jgi:hypothetical protein
VALQPQGESIRKAVQWISEQRRDNPGQALADLLDEAGVRFDLNPMEVEFLARTIREGAA